jgi:hypothetical protein
VPPTGCLLEMRFVFRMRWYRRYRVPLPYHTLVDPETLRECMTQVSSSPASYVKRTQRPVNATHQRGSRRGHVGTHAHPMGQQAGGENQGGKHNRAKTTIGFGCPPCVSTPRGRTEMVCMRRTKRLCAVMLKVPTKTSTRCYPRCLTPSKKEDGGRGDA